MLLGNRLITTGDTRRYEVDYADFLQTGDVIASATVSENGPTSQTGSAVLDVSQTKFFFFLTAGVVGEAFTVSLQIKTVFGEIVNHTINFQVVPA